LVERCGAEELGVGRDVVVDCLGVGAGWYWVDWVLGLRIGLGLSGWVTGVVLGEGPVGYVSWCDGRGRSDDWKAGDG